MKKKRKRLFLGWIALRNRRVAIKLYKYEAVTKDRLFLKAQTLFDRGLIDSITHGDLHDNSIHINRVWRNQKELTLHRVYAH